MFSRRSLLVGAGLAAGGVVAGALSLGRVQDRAAASPFRLLLCGDVNHGESYPTGGARAVERHGYDRPFERLRPLLGSADFTIANFETVASNRRGSALPGKDYLHFTDPALAPPALARAGIDAVSLANNHALDLGPAGLADSRAALDAAGIAHFGAGANQGEAERPLLLEIPGNGRDPRHLAIFGLFEDRPAYREQFGFYADARTPGTATLDPQRFGQQVAALRKEVPDLTAVAYPHWGANYRWRSSAQRQLARALVDNGADLVIGHHSHCPQEIERYRGKWIVYGIGNLYFGSNGRFADFPEVLPLGMIAELRCGARADEDALRLYPLASDNLVTGWQPHLLAPPDGRAALERILQASGISPSRRGLAIAADDFGSYLQLG